MAEETIKKTSARKKIIFALFLIVCLAVALTVGLVLHFLRPTVAATLSEQRNDIMVDCYPGASPTEEACKQRGCVWAPTGIKGAPNCTFPAAYGYKMVGDPTTTPSGMLVELERMSQPEFLPDSPAIDNIYLSVEYRTNQSVRLRFYPKNGTRWEIPDSALSIPAPGTTDESGRLYNVELVNEPHFGIVITRKSTNETIWNSTLPGFIYSDQYLQMTTRLASGNLYGLGEHNHRQFRHNLNWKTWSIFTRDIWPVDEWNSYGAHPTYLNMEDDGNAHMVFLKNSNAMEVALQPPPHPAVTFRTIGGVLDFYIFLGPSPGEAVSQYTEAVGRPVMPPYWTLGYHLCRWGYVNITDLEMVINRNRAAGVPYDAQWVDLEYMYEKYVFSYDRRTYPGLPELVRDLHDHNQKFVVIVDPGIGSDPEINAAIKTNSPGYDIFADGEREGILVMNPNKSGPLISELWPGTVAYPDFSNPKTEAWWEKWATYFYVNESIEFDSLWIDMNEPSSFVPGSVSGCEKNNLNNPPYVPNVLGTGEDGRLYDKTICMDSQHTLGDHYNVHSLYAHLQAIQTYNVLKKMMAPKRPWTMTRSSFAGTGKFATKWMGDNQARWSNMKWSIVGVLEFGLFGFSLNGADICGFWYEAEYEMCIRWHQLGAFYPFARNHNGRGDDPVIFKHQDPGAWDDRFLRLAKESLMTRYKLLPYYYTLMHMAHIRGDTVMRPLMFEFPKDKMTLDIDEQFLIGGALLVSPALRQGQTSVRAYFPKARWYEYFSGTEMSAKGKHMDIDTPLDKFNLHVRGGYVVPWQLPSNTTHASRQNSMGAIVALDESGKAEGDLFWDDGETIDTYENNQYLHVRFEMPMNGHLKISPIHNGYNANPVLDTIELYGLKALPDYVTVDGNVLQPIHVRESQNIVQLTGLNLNITAEHNVVWIVS